MKTAPAPRSLVRSSRVFTLWMILMLAFAMLPALPTQDASAQTPTPTATPETGEAELQVEGEAQQEAEPTPTNTVVADAPPPDDKGEITVQTYACDPAYDASGKTLPELLSECDTPLSEALFTIPLDAGGQFLSSTREDGYLTWQGISPGGATVLETPPAGFLVARVFCVDRPKVDETSDPGNYQEATLSPENGIDVEILAGREFHCYWFNIPAVDEVETGEIVVRKYVCPDDYDPSTADLETLQQNCPDVQSGVEFEYIVDGGSAVPGTTNQDGIISWTDVDPGEVTIRETPLAGYLVARVFCHVHDSTESNFLTSAYVEIPRVTPNEIAGDLDAGRTIDCIWFNVPVDEEYGTVYVYKYVCHPDFDHEGASREDLEINCTEPQQGVSFGVGAEAAPYQDDRSTDSSGVAIWEEVPAGGIGILEGPHDGYVLAGVYCGVVAQNNATVPGSWEEVPYQDGLEYHLPAGEYVHCIFYNAPDPDHGSIVITKYLCGAIQVAIDSPGPDYNIFSNQCTDIGVGYVFSLQTTAGDIPGESDSNGEARWTGLDPGDVTVSETLPTGYGSYAVYCTTDLSGGVYDAYAEAEETSFVYTVVGGETLYCSWFNFVPDSNTRVKVVKYLCEPAFDYEAADYPGHLAACTETISDVPFRVYNADGYNSPKLTDEEGTAAWNSVPAGPISIQETPGSDYLPVKVYCELSPIEGPESGLFQGYDLDFEDYYIEIGVPDGQSLVCHWFNLPVEVGTVVIYKYTCDSLFLTRGEAGYEDYTENCTTPGEGFTYGLYDADTQLIDEQTTGPDGMVSLSAPDAGTYSLLEEPLPDYLTLAVYCTDDVTVPPTTLEDSPVSLDLTPGVTLTCFWFNIFYEAPPYDPGSIVIHKYDCPPGFPTEPPSGRSPNSAFFNGCQLPASGVNFNVEQGGANVGSGETDANGTAIITGVSPGTTRISELPREGYQPPKIFCANYPTTGPTILFAYNEQTVDNWGHSIDLVEGNILECYWFNFPNSEGEDGQPIQIIVHKYLCETGYEYSGQTYESIAADCASAEEGVNFDISGGDGATSGGPTDLNGYAEYNGVVPGSISMTETPRQGYQTLAVYCTNYITSPGTPSLFPSEEGQLNYYLAPGYTLECYWYNAEVVEHGHVTVLKHVCEDYEYETASRDDLWTNCTEKLSQVNFTLAGPGGYSELRTTNDDGEAGWEEVRPGTFSLTETPPTGYYPVRIFCTEVPLTGPFVHKTTGEGEWDDYTASPDNILDIEIEVRAGYWLFCEWYNAPAPEHGTVHVYKYYCPEDYDYSTASRDELYAACNQAHEGVEYHLTADDYADSQTTDTSGQAVWEAVPSGPAAITEVPPSGYVPVRVYCGETETNTGTLPSTWQDYAFGNDWTITFTVPTGYYVTCEWYNFPYEEDPPQVWIQKYNCPEEADWQWSYHQFLSACHEPGANVEYGIGPDENALSLAVTDALGRIILGDLDPGTLVIQESLPSGYGGVVVYCQYVSLHHTGDYQRAEVYDQTIKLHLEDGYVITCVWFNLLEGHEPPPATPPAGGHQPLQPDTSGGATGIPATGGAGIGVTGSGQTLPEVDPSTPATLIITKYTCEPGYDVHLDESDPATDCDTLTDEIPFHLTSEDPDFEAQQGLTGDDGEGKVAFSDLAAGPYLLTEERPEATAAAFIYTCESDQREFQEENPFTPFAYAGPDGRIGVTLIPGETLECDWYDVPEDQPGGEVMIIKYACPGTSVIVAQCEIYPDGATVGLFPVGDSGEIVELTTGEDGTATAALEGTYTVQEIPTTACLIDSDAFDLAGNLVVNEGDQVEVRVYNCGLQP